MQTVLSVLNFLFILVEVLVIFNLLIIVHEMGHFLAAKWRGLWIERFGIWFGKPLIERKIGGIPFSLGCIPAGGFVALPQMAPMDIIEGKADVPRETLPPASVLDKIIVALAGPVFSFGLAIVFATIVWAIGKPTTESETTTVIGFVEDGSPAEKAGLKPGDEILRVDGKPVSRFGGMVNSVSWRVIRSEGETIPFTIRRNGEDLTINTEYVKESASRFGRAALRQVRIGPKTPAIIEKVRPGTPAEEAGLKAGDTIVEVNGKPVYSHVALGAAITKNPQNPVSLLISRAGQTVAVSLTPVMLPDEEGGKRMQIGIVWDPGKLLLAHPSPSQQIADSVTSMINMIGALVSPKSDVKAQHFSGPVGIMNLYYRMFEAEDGWRLALWFSVLFNVNLAVLNMLPIPVLDGGHIVIAIVEGIRRKPANPKVIEMVTGACAFVIISFMLYVSFFDVQDLPWSWKRGAGSNATQPAK